jgi:hypothetical protein
MVLSRWLAAACALALLLEPTLAPAQAAKPGKVSVYFAAHEDDWQLFMNPSAFEDVGGGAGKTVFVHLTAGDAGLATGAAGRKHPYYLARENGALEAIRFMTDADKSPLGDRDGTMIFNGHAVFRVSYPATVAYFLRLPDGNISGDGFAGTGFQSLKRLADGTIGTLSAIDGSTTYRGWSDLVATLRDIIAYERGAAPLLQINVADTNERINPGDHSDHLMTAKAALEAAQSMRCVRRVYYVDYASAQLPANLNAQERDMESAVFAVTLAGVIGFDHGTSWHHYDGAYVGRNYFRADEPGGNCTAANTAIAAKH